jgi:hypothetical protein
VAPPPAPVAAPAAAAKKKKADGKPAAGRSTDKGRA